MSQTLCVECGVLSDANDCPLCDLEKRVKELERKNVHAPSGTNLARATSYHLGIEPSGHSEMPSEPKPELYSGFTADEWNQMLKDGPLLLEQPNKRLIWIDQFETEDDVPLFSWGDHITFIHEVKLIEQPNWRPHMTDECAVPERVRVQVEYERNPHVGEAGEFSWEYKAGVRAYRILGT